MMKYLIGSLIISFGVLFIAVVVMMAMNVKAPENAVQYFGLAWCVLAIVSYPLAKRLIR